MYLIFDTETTLIPQGFICDYRHVGMMPRLIELSYMLCSQNGGIIHQSSLIVRPEGFTIPEGMIHGITQEQAMQQGVSLSYALDSFFTLLEEPLTFIGHNINFDLNVMAAEYLEVDKEHTRAEQLFRIEQFCTMEGSRHICKLGWNERTEQYKRPKLVELHEHLFRTGFTGAHRASADVAATARCFFELKRLGHAAL